jgi:methyl-accepting chemotaxis protein
MDRIRAELAEMEDTEKQNMVLLVDDYAKISRVTLDSILYGTLACFLLLAVLGFWIGRSITVPVKTAVAGVTSAAVEILAATTEQASATAEEAAAVRQTAATVVEVRQTAELATQRARTVVESADAVARVVQDGQRAVADSIRGSEDTKTRMEALAERILALSEQANAIAEINATVNDIAEQSNLLAVNAGIEAAKAGDAGRGFAVVAGEVKALAEQSKQATAQVRTILGDIQRATQAAVLAAEQGVKSVEAGVATAGRAGEAIRALSDNVGDAAGAAQQILAASQQQAVGMDQMMLAMNNIEQSSVQTVAGTRQVENAARNLNVLARMLAQLVGGLSADRHAEG